jgi:hypothetical protein
MGPRDPIMKVRQAAFFLALVLLAACGGERPPEVPEGTITREQFMTAWIDLRFAALEAGLPEPTPEARDSVLVAHDLTAADLFQFVEAYGRDVPFMRNLWEEIEDSIQVFTESDPIT